MKWDSEKIKKYLLKSNNHLDNFKLDYLNLKTQYIYNKFYSIDTPKCKCGNPLLFLSFNKGYSSSCTFAKVCTNIQITLNKQFILKYIFVNNKINCAFVRHHKIQIKKCYNILYDTSQVYCLYCKTHKKFISFKDGYSDKRCKCRLFEKKQTLLGL